MHDDRLFRGRNAVCRTGSVRAVFDSRRRYVVAGNAFSGRVTCTSSANTSGTLTWAVARLTQPVCTIVGETTAVTTITANSTTVLTWNYASTVSPIFDYVCISN